MATPERQGVVTAFVRSFSFSPSRSTRPDSLPPRLRSYQQTQRLLCITGICLVIPLFAAALVTKNIKLGDEQSAPDAEGGRSEDVLVGEEKKSWFARF